MPSQTVGKVSSSIRCSTTPQTIDGDEPEDDDDVRRVARAQALRRCSRAVEPAHRRSRVDRRAPASARCSPRSPTLLRAQLTRWSVPSAHGHLDPCNTAAPPPTSTTPTSTARWELGNWSATEIDFTQDRIDWHEKLTEEQRRARALVLQPLLPRRGRGHRRALAVHRRRAARGAEVLHRHAAGRRGAARRLLQALHGRGRRARRRDDGRRHGGDRGPAHVGPPQGVRPARGDGRAACAATRARASSRPR